MKPRTNFDRRIIELKDSLPQAPKKIKNWAYKKYIKPIGFTSNGELGYCGHCGKSFPITQVIGAYMNELKERKKDPCFNCPRSSCTDHYDWKNKKYSFNPLSCDRYQQSKDLLFDTYCPHCKNRLVMHFTFGRKIRVGRKVSALINYKGIQLWRYFMLVYTFEKGKPWQCESIDLCTRWICENGTIRTTRIKRHYNDHDENGKLKPSLTNDDIVGYTSGWSAQGFRKYHYHDFYCDNLYPGMNLAPYLKIRGLDKISSKQLEEYRNLDTEIFNDGTNPIQFIKYLLKYPLIETLVKNGDFRTLHTFFSYRRNEFETVLPSYLIMKRHNYIPSDLKLWIDMVLLYHRAGKDIRNPKFICPEDLQQGHAEAQTIYNRSCDKEHEKRQKGFENARPRDIFWFLDHHKDEELKCANNDEYLYKLAENYGGLDPGWHVEAHDYWDEEKQVVKTYTRRVNDNGLEEPFTMWDYLRSLENQEFINNYAKYEEKFKKLKGRFFEIEFFDDELIIKTLNSLEEYKDEGIKMHNCIESNEYWRKPSTLILSVRKDEEIVANVEISLRTFKILQCWGPCNQPTPYRDKIEKLIEENIHLIKERMQ